MRYTFKITTFLVFCFVLFCTVAVAAGPDPKDHEFNPDIPKKLKGEMIALTTESGIPFQAYESNPQSESTSAILLVHEWWGLNAHMKHVADHFAKMGYHALAVDLYNEKFTNKKKQAAKWMSEVKTEEALPKLEASLGYLALKSRKTAVIGWCFGGG